MKKNYSLLILIFSCFFSKDDESWIPKADFAGSGRSGCIYFSIGDKGYVGAGDLSQTSFSGSKLSNDFWEYDPAKDKWTQKANMPLAHRNGIGFSLEGKGYVIAGWTGKSSDSKKEDELTDFWQYDPTTNKWTKKSNFPRGYPSNGFTAGGKGYVLDFGHFFTKRENYGVWEYDPAADSWSKKSGIDVKGIGSQIFVADNIAYFINSEKKIINAYDIVSGQWSEKTKYKGKTCGGEFCFTYKGKAYFGGGECGDNTVPRDLFEYDPAINEVTEFGRIFSGNKGAIAITIGNRIFGGLGQRAGAGKSKDWYEYKPQ
ncbi:MAG: hypothetical protein HY063_11685 [Bacteroidetes bacterium]|nr:hypothetical protein [Bacteroidota bacterium]